MLLLEAAPGTTLSRSAPAVAARSRSYEHRSDGGAAGPPGKRRLTTAARYLSAPAAVAVAALLKWWLEASVGPLPTFIIFYPAILAVASIAGGGPGVLATLLSAIVAARWYFPPVGQFSGKAPNEAVAVLIFAVFNVFLCILAERLRRTRWAAAVSAAQKEDLALLDLGNLLFLDPEYRIIHWSQGCRRLYGYEAGEALAGWPRSCSRPTFRSRWRRSAGLVSSRGIGKGS